MTLLPAETEIKFDYSVGTEDRFAIRKWIRRLSESQSRADLGILEKSCADDLVALGFTSNGLARETFLRYMKQIHNPQKKILVSYPNLEVSFNRFLFDIGGTLEMFFDGVLSMEGTFESRVRKVDDQFQFVWIKFYPRMSVAVLE